jgi:sugar phosphate permease
LAIWFFFTCAIFFSFIGLWGGPFLMQIYALSKAKTGHVLSMAAIGMIGGSPLLSYLSNHLFKARKPILILASILMLIITGVLYFFTQGIPMYMLYLICLGIGMFSGAAVTIGFTTNKELFPVSIAGTATGLVNFFPFLGGAVFQIILGTVLDSQGHTPSGDFALQGFRYSLLVLFCCGCVALICSLFLKETMKE